jgi:hypothetical protein
MEPTRQLELTDQLQSLDLESLNRLLSGLDIEAINAAKKPAERFANLVSFTSQFIEGATALGQAAYQLLQQETPPSKTCLISTYEWPEILKGFSLFLRDQCFELSKAIVFYEDKQVSKEQFEAFLNLSDESMRKAKKKFSEASAKLFNQSDLSFENKREEWQHQLNPWPTYSQQFQTIIVQVEAIKGNFEILRKAQRIYANIKKSSLDNFRNALLQYQAIKSLNEKARNIVEENCQAKSVENFARMAEQLESLKKEFTPIAQLNFIINHLESIVEKLPKTPELIIGKNGGLLQKHELNLRRRTKEWLEYQVFPLIYEVWESLDTTTQRLNLAISNIQNQAQVLAGDPTSEAYIQVERKKIIAVLDRAAENIDDAENATSDLENLAKSRFAKEFIIANIFKNSDDFLEVPFQFSLQKAAVEKNKWLGAIVKWGKKRINNIQRKITILREAEDLSLSEMVVRYLKARSISTDNSHYTSIFLTRGFVGESFIAGREREIRRIENLIQNWREGYRGALLLSGKRLSGKTLLGELTFLRHFQDNAIRLAPNTEISIDGRSFTTTYNLGEALEFIRKNTITERPLIWIDDIELWANRQHSWLKNIRSLLHHIDNFSNAAFYMVAINNAARNHLEKLMPFTAAFQAEINLDKMPLTEVMNAIIIRHDATHMDLVDTKGKPISDETMKKFIRRIYLQSKGNIGDALNLWASAIAKEKKDEVQFACPYRWGLPDFLDHDNGLLLASIFKSKATTEYQLRKRFGPAFSTRYSPVVRRLAHLGVLVRNQKGMLEPNELMVNDLGRILHANNLIKYIVK